MEITDRMKRTVVISRYNEPTDWIKSIPCNYIVYNKGEDIKDSEISKDNIIKVPNEGREAETFLRYIVSHYDQLPDSIVFLQGNPFDHHPNTLSDLKLEEFGGILKMGGQTFCDRNGNNSYPGLPVYQIQKILMPELDPEVFNFTAGAQYMIKKEYIINKPLSWWEKVLGLYNYYWFSNIESGYGHKPGVFIAHVFERIWEYLFKYEIPK